MDKVDYYSKKILVINNYSMKKTMKWAKAKFLPFHHVWGIDELEKHYKLRFLNYRCPRVMSRMHMAKLYYIVFQLLSLLMSLRCECIYAAASPYIDLLAFLHYKGWMKKRIYMIVHHPGNFSLYKMSYTKLIFISRVSYDKACQDYPSQKEMFAYDEWGPDIAFYDHVTVDDVKREEGKCQTFVSNGKSNRDNNCLVEAARGSSCKVVIICTNNSFPTNYNKDIDKNVQIMQQSVETIMNRKMMSYSNMAKLMSQFNVVVIPVPEGYASLCGLTSFNDAIAMGKPVIIADTANLGIDVESEGFGFVYRAGDAQDLRSKMDKFIKNPGLIDSYGQKARAYADANDNKSFSRRLLEIIES